VRAVTAPVNERSVAFHKAIGFEVERVDEDYDGRGEARVLLRKELAG
jgi:RimJ/RimL family protein N-acetyltransferase